jgi:hypothetical protein
MIHRRGHQGGGGAAGGKLLCSMYHNNRHNYTQLYCIYTLTTPIYMIHQVNSSDYAIAQFRFLSCLMLKVGVCVCMYHNNRHNYTD